MQPIQLTSSKQLPRTLAEPLPGETPERAAQRIAARYGWAVQAYQLGGRWFFAPAEQQKERE